MPSIDERFASDADGSKHWPAEVRLKRAERCLEVAFEDGRRFTLSAELLRVESPSAEVQGHGPRSCRTIVPGRSKVGIVAVEPVGNYAVRLIFDDGHDSGLYSWTYLYRLGTCRDEIWAEYLAALAARGLSRDP